MKRMLTVTMIAFAVGGLASSALAIDWGWINKTTNSCGIKIEDYQVKDYRDSSLECWSEAIKIAPDPKTEEEAKTSAGIAAQMFIQKLVDQYPFNMENLAMWIADGGAGANINNYCFQYGRTELSACFPIDIENRKSLSRVSKAPVKIESDRRTISATASTIFQSDRGDYSLPFARWYSFRSNTPPITSMYALASELAFNGKERINVLVSAFYRELEDGYFYEIHNGKLEKVSFKDAFQ